MDKSDVDRIVVQAKMMRPILQWDLIDSLFAGLIKETEQAIEASIQKFKDKGPEVFIHTQDDEYFEATSVYGELDDSEVDLTWVFTKYYPGIMRRSAYLTMFGILEHELTECCNTIIRRYKFPLALGDIKGQGLDVANTFLQKVVNNNNHYSHFKEVRKLIALRNVCAHSDGTFRDGDTNAKRLEELAYQNKRCFEIHEMEKIFANDNDEEFFSIELKPGSLTLIREIFHKFVSEVEISLENYMALKLNSLQKDEFQSTFRQNEKQ